MNYLVAALKTETVQGAFAVLAVLVLAIVYVAVTSPRDSS